MLKSLPTTLRAALINFLLFIIFFIFFHPVYNSGEDVNVLYLLSGSYGASPTILLHYDLGLHPLFNWVIKSLFQVSPSINWYTLALVCGHFISCTIILSSILRRPQNLLYLAGWAAAFLVFEGYFLLFPDFTGTCMILTGSALIYLLDKSWQDALKMSHCILAILLLLFASFFRMETMLVLPGVALPFLAFTSGNKYKWKLLGVLVIATGLIFLFNFFQKSYYQSKITNWHDEEVYRQKILRFYNEAASLKRPEPGEKWFNELQVIKQGVIIDTSQFGVVLLDSIHRDLKQNAGDRKSAAALKKAGDWRKWFLINNSIFLATTFLFILLFGLKRNLLPSVLISILFLAAGLWYLMTRAKIESYILIYSLYFLCVVMLLYPGETFLEKRKSYFYLSLALLSAFSVWASIRIVRTSSRNKWSTQQMKSQYAEIAAHPGILFIRTTSFDINKFYAWDSPRKYPLPNYLHTERFICNNYQSTIDNFGIAKAGDIVTASNVLLLGYPSPGLAEYFSRIAKRPVHFEPAPGFRTMHVFKIIIGQ